MQKLLLRWKMKNKIVIGIFICTLLLGGCSASKIPKGSFSGNMGMIIIDKSHIEFVDIDGEFLKETYAAGEAGKTYFTEYSKGIILTEEEVAEIKKQYYKVFDSSLYSNKEYTYEYEYNASEYLWEYFLKDEEGNGIWSFTYYEEDDYIDFQGETFCRQ